jgi:hypothetical protein
VYRARAQERMPALPIERIDALGRFRPMRPGLNPNTRRPASGKAPSPPSWTRAAR